MPLNWLHPAYMTIGEMPSYGDIEHFSGTAADRDTYMECVEQYLIGNDLGETALGDNAETVQAREKKKRRAILLSVIGADTYSLLKSLCLPTKPAEKSCWNRWNTEKTILTYTIRNGTKVQVSYTYEQTKWISGGVPLCTTQIVWEL